MQTAKPSKQPWFAAVWICLAIGTFILYLPVIHNGFTNFDDGVYIPENSHVASGLSWRNIAWSFTHFYAGYWIPLTWISHMIDCQLFGLNPGAHHMVSVLIHAANTVLLFVLLNRLTGALWRSAFVAALFAWHPLHVESVAWACERKDVLCAFFWMLTLLCYARYARGRAAKEDGKAEPSPHRDPLPSHPMGAERGQQSNVARGSKDKRQSPNLLILASSAQKPGEGELPSSILHPPSSLLFYWLALFFFACGLMSKPMVVTLPFVLLLLDFWPLGRFKGTDGTIGRLVIEKIPFFVLSLGAALATKHATPTLSVSLSFRMAKSLFAYLSYISKTLVPVNLAVLYPLPTHAPVAGAIAGAVVLLACTLSFIFLCRRRPYLLVGWLWFLGTLVPVIGIEQAGYQSIADRFMYLPSIGLFILIAWGLADIFHSPQAKPFLGIVAIASLIACLVLTSIQIRYWRSSSTLFRHTLAVTTDNYVASACLGQALDAAGDDADALTYCNEAVRLNPDYASAQLYLGMVLSNEGDLTNALVHLNKAVQLAPDDLHTRYNLARILLEHGKTDDAIKQFNTLLAQNPDFAEAHNALGKAYLQQGALQKAANELLQAVKLEPNSAEFHYDLGTVLLRGSQTEQAIAQFTEAVRLKPDYAVAHENLAVALAGQGDMAGAIQNFATTAELEPNDPEAHFNLGFAYLNDRQPAQASAQFHEEIRLTPNEPKAHYRLAQTLREQNELSQAVTEYRKALELSPGFADAKKELDEILAAHPQLR